MSRPLLTEPYDPRLVRWVLIPGAVLYGFLWIVSLLEAQALPAPTLVRVLALEAFLLAVTGLAASFVVFSRREVILSDDGSTLTARTRWRGRSFAAISLPVDSIEAVRVGFGDSMPLGFRVPVSVVDADGAVTWIVRCGGSERALAAGRQLATALAVPVLD